MPNDLAGFSEIQMWIPLVRADRTYHQAAAALHKGFVYRGGMRSHSKARSLPASLLQFVIFIFFNVLMPTGCIPAGHVKKE